MTDRKARVECENPADYRAMWRTAADSPRTSGCRVYGTMFIVKDELQFLKLKLAYGAKEIGDEI